MSRTIVQIAAAAVEANSMTQCEAIILALADDGTLWLADNRGIGSPGPWFLVENVPQGTGDTPFREPIKARIGHGFKYEATDDGDWIMTESGLTVAEVSNTILCRELVENASAGASADLLKIVKELCRWESDPDAWGGDLAELACEARTYLARVGAL